MRSGELRERVAIQRASSTSDGMGGQDVTWTTVYTLWAKVRPVKGREVEHLGRTITLETYLITVRYGADIAATDRAVWNGKTLDITSAQDREGDRRWLTLEAEAGRGSP